MRRTILIALFVCLCGATFPALADDNGQDQSNRVVLEFHTMSPVMGAFVGMTNPIRGVPGGGLPWMFLSTGGAKGELHRDGMLDVRVRGLVLANMAPVPANLQGTNPIPMFKAIVSCLIDSGGMVVPVNVSTNTFPASTAGDSMIRDHVTLPGSCVAPIVFVTSAGGAWFAATGL